MNGITLLILIDTGAGTSLILEQLANKLKLVRQPLPVPILVLPAIQSKPNQLTLKEYNFSNIEAPSPSFTSRATAFKIAPLGEDYDIILGALFLSKHQLDVSLSQRLICNAQNGYSFREQSVIDEMRLLRELKDKREALVKTVFENVGKVKEVNDFTMREVTMLKEFEDFFPEELPAVYEDPELEGDEVFPEEPQSAAPRIHHCIILTDPDVQIN